MKIFLTFCLLFFFLLKTENLEASFSHFSVKGILLKKLQLQEESSSQEPPKESLSQLERQLYALHFPFVPSYSSIFVENEGPFSSWIPEFVENQKKQWEESLAKEQKNRQGQNLNFDLGVYNQSGVTFQRPYGSVAVGFDRQVRPNFATKSWETKDTLTFSFNVSSYLTFLKEQSLLDISSAQLGLFAGLFLRYNFSVLSPSSSYEEGLVSSFLPLLEALMNPASIPKTGIIVEKDFSFHFQSSLQTQLSLSFGANLGIEGKFLKESYQKTILTSLEKEILVDQEKNESIFFHFKASLLIDILKLFKLSLFSFELTISQQESRKIGWKLPKIGQQDSLFLLAQKSFSPQDKLAPYTLYHTYEKKYHKKYEGQWPWGKHQEEVWESEKSLKKIQAKASFYFWWHMSKQLLLGFLPDSFLSSVKESQITSFDLQEQVAKNKEEKQGQKLSLVSSWSVANEPLLNRLAYTPHDFLRYFQSVSPPPSAFISEMMRYEEISAPMSLTVHLTLETKEIQKFLEESLFIVLPKLKEFCSGNSSCWKKVSSSYITLYNEHTLNRPLFEPLKDFFQTLETWNAKPWNQWKKIFTTADYSYEIKGTHIQTQAPFVYRWNGFEKK